MNIDQTDAVQKAKFQYFLLGEIINKTLDKNERYEGLLKRLKNIEDKTDNQLDLIKDQGDKQLDLIGKVNLGKTKNIRFQDEGLKDLKEETDKKKKISEREIKVQTKKKEKSLLLILVPMHT